MTVYASTDTHNASNTLEEFKSTVLAGYRWIANTFDYTCEFNNYHANGSPDFAVEKPTVPERVTPQTQVVDYRKLDV